MAKIGDMDFATLRESVSELGPEDYAVISNVRQVDFVVRLHLAIHRATGATVVCGGCGMPFWAKQPNAATCSDTCRKRVARGRGVAQRAAEANGGIEPQFGTALTLDDAIAEAES